MQGENNLCVLFLTYTENNVKCPPLSPTISMMSYLTHIPQACNRTSPDSSPTVPMREGPLQPHHSRREEEYCMIKPYLQQSTIAQVHTKSVGRLQGEPQL